MTRAASLPVNGRDLKITLIFELALDMIMITEARTDIRLTHRHE